MRFLLCSILFATLAVSAGPRPTKDPVAPIPLPAGVADPAGKIGYLTGATGVIEAFFQIRLRRNGTRSVPNHF